jgi:hypothetical protein
MFLGSPRREAKCSRRVRWTTWVMRAGLLRAVKCGYGGVVQPECSTGTERFGVGWG